MKGSWFSFSQFVLIVIMSGYLMFDYFLFRHQGARFTAEDGQTLCQRVQKIDGLVCNFDRRR